MFLSNFNHQFTHPIFDFQDYRLSDLITFPASFPVCQLHCSFERDLCHWNQLLTDVFDWTRHSGSTPTMITGPSSDHTTGGSYTLTQAK